MNTSTAGSCRRTFIRPRMTVVGVIAGGRTTRATTSVKPTGRSADVASSCAGRVGAAISAAVRALVTLTIPALPMISGRALTAGACRPLLVAIRPTLLADTGGIPTTSGGHEEPDLGPPTQGAGAVTTVRSGPVTTVRSGRVTAVPNGPMRAAPGGPVMDVHLASATTWIRPVPAGAQAANTSRSRTAATRRGLTCRCRSRPGLSCRCRSCRGVSCRCRSRPGRSRPGRSRPGVSCRSLSCRSLSCRSPRGRERTESRRPRSRRQIARPPGSGCRLRSGLSSFPVRMLRRVTRRTRRLAATTTLRPRRCQWYCRA